MSASVELAPFLTIYREYFGFVWSCVVRLGVSAAAVDDAVQEVFIVIHSRLHTLERPESLRSWIYGVVRRTVSHHHRSRRVLADFAATLETQSDAPSPPTPFDVAERNEKVKLFWSLVEELDEAKRELLLMVEIDQLAVPEVAEILEIPLNTAYSRLRAARQAFEDALARRMPRSEREGGTCCL